MTAYLTWRDRAWLWYCRNHKWVIDLTAFGISAFLTWLFLFPK